MNKIVFIILIFQFFNSELLARNYIIIQSTTSTENSGLLNVLEKAFENKFQIDLRFVTAGSGQAINNVTKGNGDILMIHSKVDEMKFIEEGYGVERFEVMYNDFIIVGPNNDPSGISEAYDIIDVMRKLALGISSFLSRDDNSGTHKKELSLWQQAEIEITENDKWYLKNGLGMGKTLNMASEIDAYTLTDRGTWLFFNNKQDLNILFEESKSLHNPYGVIAVNPKKFPHVEHEKSMVFINWLLSNEGKFIINGYKIDGQQLFFTY